MPSELIFSQGNLDLKPHSILLANYALFVCQLPPRVVPEQDYMRDSVSQEQAGGYIQDQHVVSETPIHL